MMRLIDDSIHTDDYHNVDDSISDIDNDNDDEGDCNLLGIISNLIYY